MEKLYDGNMRKKFFLFSLPLILTIFLTNTYQIVNTMMSSHLIGEQSISAIGSTAPLISFISSICWGYGTGFSVYVAMLIGKGDYDKMANVIKVNMLLSSAVIILLSILCIGFHKIIFDFLKIEDAIRKDAFNYYAIYIAGLVFLHLNWCGVYISNALGMTKLPLFASIISNVLNISLSYILVKYFKMGVSGFAVATIASAFLVAIFYFIAISKTILEIGVNLKGIYFDKNEIKNSLIYAFPSALQQSIMYLCTAIVSPLTNLCGASAIAGYTVGMRIYDIEAGIYQNSNKTISTFVAQCMGAKKYDIIKKGIRTGMTQTYIILAIFLTPVVLCGDIISDLFLDLPESINYASVFLKFCLPFVVFNTFNNLYHAVFRSSGAGRYLVISTFVYAVSRVFFSYILFPKYQMYGIYAGIVLSWVVEAIFGTIIYFSGKWKSVDF